MFQILLRDNFVVTVTQTTDTLRILVFKRDPNAVDGQRVLLILISVIVTGHVTLKGSDVRHILHTEGHIQLTLHHIVLLSIESLRNVYIVRFLLWYFIVNPLISQANNSPPVNQSVSVWFKSCMVSTVAVRGQKA